MKQNSILIFSILVFAVCVSFVFWQWKSSGDAKQYFGNSLTGQGYWLHKDNNNVAGIEFIRYVHGRLGYDVLKLNGDHYRMHILNSSTGKVEYVELPIDYVKDSAFGYVLPSTKPFLLQPPIMRSIRSDSYIGMEIVTQITPEAKTFMRNIYISVKSQP